MGTTRDSAAQSASEKASIDWKLAAVSSRMEVRMREDSERNVGRGGRSARTCSLSIPSSSISWARVFREFDSSKFPRASLESKLLEDIESLGHLRKYESYD